MGDILRALEGNLTPIECPALEAESECVKESSCVTKVVWKRIDDALKDAVDNISLQELKQLELANEGGSRRAKPEKSVQIHRKKQ